MGISTNLRCSRVATYAHSVPRSDGSPAIQCSHHCYPTLRNRLTALIIDGSEFQRMYHQTLLSTFGVNIYEVKNGYEAFGLILRGIEFDVIFIDMDLPVLNGALTTRILRRIGVGSMIIGIAAYANRSSDRRVFSRSGLDDYHERLFTYERLYAILRMIDDER